MTTNELKDAAIFIMAYSYLKRDSSQELGLFINKKASKFIDELLAAMTPIARYYYEHKKRIDVQITALENKAYVRKENFGTTAPQLACDLIYLRFAPNERKGQRLAPILAEFRAKRTQGAKASTDLSRVLRTQQGENNVYRKQELRYQISQRGGG